MRKAGIIRIALIVELLGGADRYANCFAALLLCGLLWLVDRFAAGPGAGGI